MAEARAIVASMGTGTAMMVAVASAWAAVASAARTVRRFAGWRGLPYIADTRLRQLGSMQFQHFVSFAGAGGGGGAGDAGDASDASSGVMLPNGPVKTSGIMVKKGSGLKNKSWHAKV